MKITYFVHATTEDNEAGLATGWADTPLSKTGLVQAQQLRDQAPGPFDVVFSSDAGRAVATTQAAFSGRFPLHQDWRLREIDYGKLTGQPSRQVKDDLTRHILEPFPDGESYAAVARRVAAFLADLRHNFAGRPVAFVAHQAPQLALDVLLAGKSWEEAFRENWRHSHAWQPGWPYEAG